MSYADFLTIVNEYDKMKFLKQKKIAVVADPNFATDVFATDPIADKSFVYNWLYKIVEKQFGEYTHHNLLSFLGREIKVKRETENGFLVFIKGEEFYIPKHSNVHAILA